MAPLIWYSAFFRTCHVRKEDFLQEDRICAVRVLRSCFRFAKKEMRKIKQYFCFFLVINEKSLAAWDWSGYQWIWMEQWNGTKKLDKMVLIKENLWIGDRQSGYCLSGVWIDGFIMSLGASFWIFGYRFMFIEKWGGRWRKMKLVIQYWNMCNTL